MRIKLKRPALNSIRFGALTPALWGGYAIVGTIVSLTNASSAASDHFQITGGYLVVSAAGAAAGLNAGPYRLVTSAGLTATITIAADAYTIGGTQADVQAQWNGTFNGTAGIGSATQATLTGKTIFIRYTPAIALNISGLNATPLRRMSFGSEATGWRGLVIQGDDPNHPPVVTDLISLTCQYLTMRYLQRSAGTTNSIQFSGTVSLPVSDIWIDQCNLWATERNVGPTADYTGNIPTFQIGTGDGAEVTFTYNTISNGGYAIWNGNGFTGSNPGTDAVVITADTVTASSGARANTTLTGTGVAAGSVTYATGAISVTFSSAPANGVPIMLTYKALGLSVFGNTIGFANVSTITSVSNIRITGCDCRYHQRMISIGPNPNVPAGTHGTPGGNLIPEALNISGNFIDGYWEAAIVIGVTNATSAITTQINDNVTRRLASVPTDNGNPHQDGITVNGGSAMTDIDVMIEVNGNFIIPEGGRGDYIAPIRLVDMSQGVTFNNSYFVATMEGNVIVASTSLEGLIVQQAKNCVIRNNTVIRGNDTYNYAGIYIGAGPGANWESSGAHTIENNLYELGFQYGGAATNVSDNIQTNEAGSGGAAAYSTVFDGPTFRPVSRAQALALLSMKAGGPADLSPFGVGAIGTGAYDFPAVNPSAQPGVSNLP